MEESRQSAVEEVSATKVVAILAFPTSLPGGGESVWARLATEVGAVGEDVGALRTTDRVRGWNGVEASEAVGIGCGAAGTGGPGYSFILLLFFGVRLVVFIGIGIGYGYLRGG